jgi:hypothetical protein
MRASDVKQLVVCLQNHTTPIVPTLGPIDELYENNKTYAVLIYLMNENHKKQPNTANNLQSTTFRLFGLIRSQKKVNSD